MKTFFVTLIAFSLVLIIGCQENTVNEPADVLLKHDDNLVTANKLKLNYELSDPLYSSSKLSGTVSYVHTIINRTINPIGLKEISLHIEMNSELYDHLGLMHLEWIVQGRSEEIFYVSEEGILLVEKSYWITNRNDVVLLVQYLVTTDGVGISNVSLTPLEK
jgi:hypothetical protein